MIRKCCKKSGKIHCFPIHCRVQSKVWNDFKPDDSSSVLVTVAQGQSRSDVYRQIQLVYILREEEFAVVPPSSFICLRPISQVIWVHSILRSCAVSNGALLVLRSLFFLSLPPKDLEETVDRWTITGGLLLSLTPDVSPHHLIFLNPYDHVLKSYVTSSRVESFQQPNYNTEKSS